MCTYIQVLYKHTRYSTVLKNRCGAIRLFNVLNNYPTPHSRPMLYPTIRVFNVLERSPSPLMNPIYGSICFAFYGSHPWVHLFYLRWIPSMHPFILLQWIPLIITLFQNCKNDELINLHCTEIAIDYDNI